MTDVIQFFFDILSLYWQLVINYWIIAFPVLLFIFGRIVSLMVGARQQ